MHAQYLHRAGRRHLPQGAGGHRRQHDRQQAGTAQGDHFLLAGIQHLNAVRCAGNGAGHQPAQLIAQQRLVIGVEQACLELVGQLHADKFSLLAGVRKDGLTHVVGKLERFLHLGIEPVVHGGGNRAKGKEKQQGAG